MGGVGDCEVLRVIASFERHLVDRLPSLVLQNVDVREQSLHVLAGAEEELRLEVDLSLPGLGEARAVFFEVRSDELLSPELHDFEEQQRVGVSLRDERALDHWVESVRRDAAFVALAEVVAGHCDDQFFFLPQQIVHPGSRRCLSRRLARRSSRCRTCGSCRSTAASTAPRILVRTASADCSSPSRAPFRPAPARGLVCCHSRSSD